MKPAIAALVALCLAGLGAFFLLKEDVPEIVITNATLVPMGAGHAVTLSIDNPGVPDRIEAVTVKAAPTMMTEPGPLIVPGGDTASLAMDGAHAMAMGVQGDEGALVPITVHFTDGGAVKTRARIAGAGIMDHGVLFDVPDGEPKPSLAINVTQQEAHWQVDLKTENFTFSEDAVDGAHVPGIGHAHLYLNGLKLGRLYSDSTQIGTLPSGTHVVSVALNTNDHQGYAVDGQAVAATVEVTVD